MNGLALITGGQRGIGLGVAQALGAAGFRLVLAAEAAPDAPEVLEALAGLPVGTVYISHDLRDAAAAPALVAGIEAQHGPIACHIANAGVPARKRGDLLDMAVENFDWTLSVNLRGAFFLAQAVARAMAARPWEGGHRCLIFVTSVSAAMASPERGNTASPRQGRQ